MPAKASSDFFSRGAVFGAIMVLTLLLLPDTLLAYPVFGTKRYGRSGSGLPHHRVSSSWGMPAPLPLQPYQQPQPRAAQTHYGLAAPAYYVDPLISYPYAQEYPPENDYIYAPQEPLYNTYPYYGGVPKYSIYQNVIPYYYDDGRHGLSSYYGYDEANDPVDDLQEEIQQEEEREEREEALPIGQETWFEGQQPQQQHDSIADVNAVFLQNLIMSHIYNDRYQNPGYFGTGNSYTDFDYGTDGWFYDTPVSTGDRGHAVPEYYKNNDAEIDDEDVRELKSLVKKNRSMEIDDYEATTGRFSKPQQDWYSPPAHQYYEPTWFVSDTATPWYEGAWGNAAYFKRNYKDKKPVSKRQESSEYAAWIPTASSAINFSDRKENRVLEWIMKNEKLTTSPPAASPEDSRALKWAMKTGQLIAPLEDSPENARAIAWLMQNDRPTTSPPVTLADTPENARAIAWLRKNDRPTASPPVASTLTSSTTTTAPEPLTTAAPDFDPRRGQKEVALLRPPTPMRHPFKSPAMDRLIMTRSRPEQRHGPSVYETIKQLLNMENKLHKGADSAIQPQQHPRPQKRFVSNEESLVEELSGLKKLAA